MVRWVACAQDARNNDASGFYQFLGDFGEMLKRHRLMKSLPIVTLRDALIQRLSQEDSTLCLVMFWMYISEIDTFRPSNKDFTKWNYPHIRLEWDHQGTFNETPTKFIDLPKDPLDLVVGVVHYSGGETKSSYNGITPVGLLAEGESYKRSS